MVLSRALRDPLVTHAQRLFETVACGSSELSGARHEIATGGKGAASNYIGDRARKITKNAAKSANFWAIWTK